MTGAAGSQPGATGPTSQGPNDPLNNSNPPANGGGAAPATGAAAAGDGAEERAEANRQQALARMAAERDEARRLLEEERRKGLSEDELKRLRALDAQTAERDAREKKLVLRYEVASRASRLGIVDPELAVLLLEGQPGVTVDPTTSVVTGLDEALTKLVKDRPYLVRAAAPADGGAGTGGNRGGSRPGMNDIIRGAARGRSLG